MEWVFKKFKYLSDVPDRPRKPLAALVIDNWDDYNYKTLFHLYIFDKLGTKHDIGELKIGCIGQISGYTANNIPKQFDTLDQQYFSLGQDVDYYLNIMNAMPPSVAKKLLKALKDVSLDEVLIDKLLDEQVFQVSLLRSVTLSTIKNQYQRVLTGGVPLTKFKFSYDLPSSNKIAGFKLKFSVDPNLKPPTNMHVLIGRNGVGKTTLLNNMAESMFAKSKKERQRVGEFFNLEGVFDDSLPKEYFARVVSVSFSSFDPFFPFIENLEDSSGTRHVYIGLKKIENPGNAEAQPFRLKSLGELREEFVKSLRICLSLSGKRMRWCNAIKKLESDDNFAEMALGELAKFSGRVDASKDVRFEDEASSAFSKMSSGHAIVLLIVTKLVEEVEEKTLVLIDEPESHLHPPLLSAFARTLSDLLNDRNGIAIIATHSPVVLQEIPRSCVWKLRRLGTSANVERPEIETFGENVGILTREVFGLEVIKSGFHDLLSEEVSNGKTYEGIIEELKDQLGYEGKAVLKALTVSKSKSTKE